MIRRVLGVDTGGTFTDFVLFEAGTPLRIHKVLSTPEAPERAILQGIAELGLNTAEILASLIVVHGSTVATNAVLEGKGVPTAFITNRGLGDMLTLGRQARAELYDLQPEPQEPPVPPALCLETGGRLGADGSVVEPLTQVDLDHLHAELLRLAPRAVAINLLFSYLDDEFEMRVRDALPRGLFISCSSRILPEYREYERGMATWLNSYVGPLVQKYLHALQKGLGEAGLSVMQSAGGTMSAEQAGSDAVHLLLSGPAGGLAGARFVGERAGQPRLLTFDMGGTSTDVALVDGELTLTTEGRIGRYPVAVSMVDMHTIGAGGGSLAYRDAGGLLRVGPESAGAVPGPACYGQGGRQPTVTDANLVLGRLRPEAFLGGRMPLDVKAATGVVGRLGEELGLGVEETAMGIINVANEHMVRALRVMSVERGVDPRQLTLVSFGGAGGLHVCALAEALGMHRAMVPVHAGVLSALGMLVAPPARFLSRTHICLIRETDEHDVARLLASLSESGRGALQAEGAAADEIEERPSVDVRYRGQSYYLNVPWTDPATVERQFHRLHARRYGHQLDLPVEMVNLRLVCRGPRRVPGWEATHHALTGEADAPEDVEVYGVPGRVKRYPRGGLAVGTVVPGPAVITETVSTTWLAPGWQAQVLTDGSLSLAREESKP